MKRLLLFAFLLAAVLVSYGGCGGLILNLFRGSYDGVWTSTNYPAGGALTITVSDNGNVTGTTSNYGQSWNGTVAGSLSNTGNYSATHDYGSNGSFDVNGTVVFGGGGELLGTFSDNTGDTGFFNLPRQ